MTYALRRQSRVPCRARRLKGVVPLLALLITLLYGCSSLPKGGGGVDTVKNQAAQYAQQGNAYYERGNYVQAEKYFKLALDADFSVDNRPGIASSYNSLGRVYLAAGNAEAAGAAFDNAVRYTQPATTPAAQALLMAAQTGKAEILLLQGSFAAALTLLKKTDGLGAPAESPERGALLHDMGAAYKGLKDYQSSLAYLDKALEAHTKLDLPAQEASDLYMIASVHSKKGDYKMAMDYAKRALDRDKFAENSVGIGSDLRALGIISEKQGEERQAYDYYYSSLQVFRTLAMASEVKELLSSLERVATKLGRTKDAAGFAEALKQMEAGK